MRPLTHQLIRNAVYGGGARAVTMAVAIPMTAYVVARIGMERFGIWALVSAAMGAMGFLDFSLRTSFVKFLAEDLACDRRDRLESVLSTGLACYTVFAVIAAVALLLLDNRILGFLNVTAAHRHEARLALYLCVARFLAGQILSVFSSICDARQRMDLTNGIGLAALAVSTALTVVLVEAGWGMAGVATGQLVGTVAFYLACIPVSIRLIGPYALTWRAVTGATFRRLFGYSVRLHVSSICGIVNNQLDKFLLVRWATLPLVGSYELALRLVANLGSFQPFLAAGLLPAASHLQSAGHPEELQRIYRKASGALFMVGIPPFVFLLCFAPEIMVAWLGHPERDAAAIMMILTVGYTANALSNGMAFVCQGIGRPDIQMHQSMLQLAANLVLSLALIVTVGPLGAPLGTSIALLAGAAYFIVIFHRAMGIGTLAYLREVALPPLGCALLAALPALAAKLLPGGTRPLELMRLAAAGTLYGAAWLPLAWRTGWLPATWRPWRRQPATPGGMPP